MPDPVPLALVLFPVGVCVGLIGSLIGVGGGFFVVPFLILFYRFDAPAATAASLGTVFLSAASASVANARRRRIDFRTGLALVAGTFPGALAGRYLIGQISDRAFAGAFGAFLVLVAGYLAFVRVREGKGLIRGASRELVDSEGQAYRYEVNLAVGVGVSLAVGLVSSLFGVGGGLILVPFLVITYGMPTLVATSTAQFIFVFTAAAGLLESVRRGQVTEAGGAVLLWMGLGVVVGAQLGVAVAKRVSPRLVRWMISTVLLTVAALLLLNR